MFGTSKSEFFAELLEHLHVCSPEMHENFLSLPDSSPKCHPYDIELPRLLVEFWRQRLQMQMFGTTKNVFGKCLKF